MSHQYHIQQQQQSQGYPAPPFAGIPVRPQMMQHLSQQQHQQQHNMHQQTGYAPSPPSHSSPMPMHMMAQGRMGTPGTMLPVMQMPLQRGEAGMGTPTSVGQQQSQPKAKKQKKSHHAQNPQVSHTQRAPPQPPVVIPGPSEYVKTIEEELMVDELERVTARDLAMYRYRSRHEYMNEILSPVSIDQLGDPIDPYRDLDKKELERKVEELEKKNAELEKQSEDHLVAVKERFAAITRGELAVS